MIRLTSAMTLNAVLTAAKTTTDFSVMVGFSDDSVSGYAGSSTLSTTNGVTPVAICSAPGASVIRDIDLVNIYNADTAAKVIQIYVTASAVNYLLLDVTLQVDDTLTYTHSDGWRIIDLNGNLKTTLSGGTASQITAAGWASPSGPIGSVAPVQFYNRSAAAVTAAGTTQGTATLLTAERNKVTTAAVGTGVVLFAPILAGLDVWVDNDTVNALNLYPQVGGQIDVLGANNPMVIPPGGSVILSASSTTQWDSYLSNNQAFTTVSTTGLATLGQSLVNGSITNATYSLAVAGTNTANLSQITGLQFNTTFSGGAGTTSAVGMYAQPTFTPAVASIGSEYGHLCIPAHNNGSNVTNLIGLFSRFDLGASALAGTVTSYYSMLAASPIINASATTNITTAMQFCAQSVTQGTAQTITNIYGYRGQQASGAGRWNLFMDGSAQNAIAGNSFFGGTTSPTAKVHIAAGTATASTAPLKLTDGTLLSAVEDGAIEYQTDHLYFTDNRTASLVRREIIPSGSAVLPSAITVGASLFTYQNTTGLNAVVAISGGTVSLVEFTRDNSTFYTFAATTGVQLMLAPSDRVRVTYSVLPTMTLIPM